MVFTLYHVRQLEYGCNIIHHFRLNSINYNIKENRSARHYFCNNSHVKKMHGLLDCQPIRGRRAPSSRTEL